MSISTEDGNINMEICGAGCMEEISLQFSVKLTCQHQFHEECIIRWFRASNDTLCPLCREKSHQFHYPNGNIISCSEATRDIQLNGIHDEIVRCCLFCAQSCQSLSNTKYCNRCNRTSHLDCIPRFQDKANWTCIRCLRNEFESIHGAKAHEPIHCPRIKIDTKVLDNTDNDIMEIIESERSKCLSRKSSHSRSTNKRHPHSKSQLVNELDEVLHPELRPPERILNGSIPFSAKRVNEKKLDNSEVKLKRPRVAGRHDRTSAITNSSSSNLTSRLSPSSTPVPNIKNMLLHRLKS